MYGMEVEGDDDEINVDDNDEFDYIDINSLPND